MPADEAEIEGSNRTRMMPNPAGRLTAAAADPVAPAPAGPADIVDWDKLKLDRLGPLVAAAAPLLTLAIRLKARAVHDNVDALRDRVMREIHAFERRVTPSGLSPQTLRASKYALCATIDDLVLATPWGSRSVWTTQSMVGTYFSETWGGDRFFDLLTQIKKDPAVNLDLLELQYYCISLGFEGRYRVTPRGASELAVLREDLYRLIRLGRGEVERDISPHWRGIQAAHRGLASLLPAWLALAIAALLAAIIYAGFSYALNTRSDGIFALLSSLPPEGSVTLARAAVPLPSPPKSNGGVQQALAPEAQAGTLSVQDGPQTVTVRIAAQGLFASGSAELTDTLRATLLKVGDVLNAEKGEIHVVGHTDNVPIRTLRFPSNWHLSLARAKAVQELLATRLKDPSRITAEGKADTQPVASNDTPAGREQNRRIEVILTKAPQ
jgi:type VI secretion system protein ImpK